MAAKIHELRRKREEAKERANAALRAAAEKAKAEGRGLNAEELAADDKLRAEVKGFDADIDLEERILASERQYGSALPAEPDAPAPVPGAGPLPERGAVHVSKPNSDQDPKRGFRTYQEFMRSVMRAGQGFSLDPRLKPLASAPMATAGSDEQGEYSNPFGGFLVPHGIAPGILSVAPEGDPLAALVTNIPMSAPSVTYNARVDKNHASSVSGGLTVSRRAETVDASSSRMQFEQVTLTAFDEWGLAYATERILMDSPESFVAILQAGFRDEYAAFAMNERINGAGSGERLGFLQSAAKIEVAKETGQAGSTIVKENIDKMEARSWRYGRAVWVANHNTRPQLKSLVQVVGTGGGAVPYFQSTGGQETLSGRPIFFSEFAKTLGTAGDIILVVPSEYLEAIYQSEQFAESIHVRFAAGERAFRFYRRTDGRPWWTSALTPKNGSTLSPIVTLAVRA